MGHPSGDEKRKKTCQKWWRCWNQTLWGHNILSSCTRSSSSSPNDRAWDKRSFVFFLHPWFDSIRVQQCTWQWCPTGRECTSLRDVLPLRCSLLPSLWSGDSNYIGGGRWGWTDIELLVKGDLDVGHAAMLHHGSHRVHGDGVRGCQADFLHVRLQDSLGID